MAFHVRINDEDSLSERGFVRVRDLHAFVEALINKIETFRQNPEFNNKIWLFFSGDKGGNSMKFHLEIINDASSGSRDAVHTFCMYEAPDNLPNMWKVFACY